MIDGMVNNKPLWALRSELQKERREQIALASEGNKEYTDWFLGYRIHVMRLFVMSENSGILKKDRKDLEVLTDYWKNLDEEILVLELIKNKILQYDYSTVEKILMIPKIEMLTNGIDLHEIYNRRRKT